MNLETLTLDGIIQYIGRNGWMPVVIDTALIFLLAFFSIAILRSIYRRMKKKHKHDRKERWISALIEIAFAMEKPLYNAILIYSAALSLEMICIQLNLSSVAMIYKIKILVITIGLTAALLKAISNIEHRLLVVKNQEHAHDATIMIDFSSKMLKAVSCIIACLIIMQAVGISINGILSFGGISGLIIGLASKDMLSNFFGTMMIYLDKPFVIGERIKIENATEEGVVEKIDWRMTCIRTNNKRLVFVPNSTFTTIAIENASRISHRVFNEEVRIDSCDVHNIQTVVESIQNMIQNHHEVDADQGVIVEISKLYYDVTMVQVKCYTHVHIEYDAFISFKNALLLRVALVVKECNCNLASFYKSERV